MNHNAYHHLLFEEALICTTSSWPNFRPIYGRNQPYMGEISTLFAPYVKVYSSIKNEGHSLANFNLYVCLILKVRSRSENKGSGVKFL